MNELAELLLDKNLLTSADLNRAEEVCARTGNRLPFTLARLGLVPESALTETLGQVAGVPILTADSLPGESALLDGLNPQFLRRRSILPIGQNGETITVAMADPQDAEAREAMAFALGLPITTVVSSFSDIDRVLARLGPADNFDDAVTLNDTTQDVERLLEEDSEAPIIRIVQRLLSAAVDLRASDVHVEPMARYLAVRYRIDGRLTEVERQAIELAAPITSRIKVMASLDIAESRLPQDGRLRITVRGRDVDVRVSTSPTAHGESIVLRLLGRSEIPLDLEMLGLPSSALEKFCQALDRPHGIILLTGPTGSGKTTTLYAAVNRLRRPEVKILTVEDPVEVLLEGVNQVQVRPEIELSYAATLRAFLRQDPDILMIGEIRDYETAEVALRASLTGHLVLSTLHTNSAIGAFTRLADIGIEPFLTASTVVAAVAQRLVRSLCTACRATRQPNAEETELFISIGLPVPQEVAIPKGCALCGESGYRGRVPLIEIVEVDDRLRQQIRDGSVGELEDAVPTPESLFGHGLMLVAQGRTTLAEIRRAVQSQ